MYFQKALIFLLLVCTLKAGAQSLACDSTFFKVIGDPDKREEGHSLAIDQAGDLYLAGTRDNMGLLLKCSPNGDVIWAKTLDFSPAQEFISEIIFDSEGMIAGCGYLGSGSVAGQAFAFRFNPATQQVLWTKTYSSGDTYLRGMMELPASGSYLLSSDTQSPNDAEFIEINRVTGNQVGTTRKVYELGTGEAYNEMEIVGNFIYGVGRFTDGNTFAQMRGTVSKLNLSDRSVVWTVLTHLPTTTPARLYMQDMIIENNNIISVTSGDDNGTSITQTEFFMQKTDFDGNVTLMKKYDVQGVANEFMQELVNVPDGYVIFGRTSIFSPSDLLIVKVDKNFNLLWAKRINYEQNDNLTQIASIQSWTIAVGSDVYFTANAANDNLGTSDILLFKMNAAGEINDSCLNIVIPVNVTVTNVPNPFVNNVVLSEFTAPLSTNNETMQVSDVAFIFSENPCPCPECVVPIPPTNLSAAVCEGESFVFFGQDLTVGGTYTQTMNSFQGCDSTVVLTLIVHPAQQTSLAVSLCDGTNYQFGGQTLTQSGVYTDTLATWQGCDSVVVLTLEFIPELSTDVNASVCEGESYVFNGNSISTAGLYLDTLAAFGGCDSIVSLNLLVWPNVQTSVNETICSTDSFLFNGDYLTQSGTYTATFQTINGCDSTVTLELDLFPFYTSQLAAVTCDGTPFVFNGVSYAQTGIYPLAYPDQNGCDSLVVLNLVVNPVIPPTIFTESLCEGESYDFYGQILTTSGSYTQTYTNLNGCDSTIVLQLTVYEHQDTSLSVLLCEGLSYDGYTEPGFYTDTLQTFAGCDSIRMLQLSFQLPADSMDVDLCDGEAFLGFTESGVYTDTVYGMDGCDTLRTYFVTANNLYVPNVFSPDDNGINDHFEIFLSEPTSIQITYFAMFDRWGNMLYEVKDNNVVKWDGDFRGKPMNPAVLSYVLLYRCNGFEKNRHGSVTIVR